MTEMRIVSLVPSITETLFDFGLGSQEIVGRTKFCIHPRNKVTEIPIIGGTKNLYIEKIKSLKPTHIIASKEENVKEQVEELQTLSHVWLTDIKSVEDNLVFLKDLGELLGKQAEAKTFIDKTEEIFNNIEQVKSIPAAYLIWKNPYMTVGGDTFISDVMQKLGFENIFKGQTRYPQISVENLEHSEIIFLSSEPFPFKNKDLEELQSLLPDQKIMLADGEAFSWYGTHISKCGEYYQRLLPDTK